MNSIEFLDQFDMNIDQLRVFVAVAERRHVTRAAEGLGMSQSAVSTAIKALERSCGVVLFNRVGRSIELSHVGRRFLPEAKAVLERATAARLFLENVSQTVTGAVSIAASQTIASYWLPRRLASFHDIHPSVRLDVTIGNTRQVEAAVLDGTADIGLVEGRTRSDLLKRVRVDTDRLVMVFAPDAATTAVRGPVDLASFRWIVRERGSGTREGLEDYMARQGKSLDDLQVFLVLPSNEAIRQAVEAGAGATIISEQVVADSLARGAVEAADLQLPDREFVLITHMDRQPSLAQSALKQHLAGTRGCDAGGADRSAAGGHSAA
ncbi:MAG TPA: LysR substrate-binding domain-containing protein [Stellaceae bacterium]|nr:LysR substrate-binding domain-containing protein [Stellaceae bacterium]